MQGGPRRGTMGRQPDPYQSQPRPSYKGGPPGYGPGANPAAGYGQDPAMAYGQDPAMAYGQDPAMGYGRSPMMMQPSGPSPNTSWIPIILSWGMFLGSLAFTGILLAGVAHMGSLGNVLMFRSDTFALILGVVFMTGALFNLADRPRYEFVKPLALTGAGISVIAAAIGLSITTKTLEEADGNLDDKLERYMIAVTAVMGAQALLSLCALISGLVSMQATPAQPPVPAMQ